MTRESYEIARILIHVCAAALAVLFAFLYRRYRKPLSLLAGLTLVLTAFVFVESVFFPVWFWIVATEVPIRDEGLAVAISHLIFIGPLALLGVVLSAPQKEMRWLGIALSLSFVVISPIVFLFDV